MTLILGAGSEGLDVGLLSSYWADEEVLRKKPCHIQEAGKRDYLLTQEQYGLTAVNLNGILHTS